MIKALGLDLGKKTLGIAVSDSLGFVHGVETFRFESFKYEIPASYIVNLAKERMITTLVLGYPLHLNGAESDMSKNVLLFKDLILKLNPNLTIELIDERLTSVSANKTLSMLDVSHQKRKDTVDTLAAVEILETFIRREANKK